MKTKVFSKLTIALVVVTLFSAIMLCGTLAKYVSTFNGTGSGTVAKWDFKVNGSAETDFTISLGDNKLMPGSTGTFNIELANSSDVAANYVVTLAAAEGAPSTLTFNATAGELSGTLDATNGQKTITVTWEWPYEGNDEADTSFGEAATDTAMKFVDITVTATQVAPTN